MPTTQKDYFEELFDRETFLQRRMILLLNEKNGYWVTREWLSEALDLSKRTTLSIINSLAEKVADLHSENFSLQLSKGKGVRLTVAIDADVYNLVTEIVKGCSTVVLLKTLILDEFQSVRHYALTHFTSESTVRRDLAKVRRMLTRYKVKISRDTFQLEGEEYQIRMIMVIFFWSIYRGSSWPFTYIDEQLLEGYVEEILDSDFTVYPNIPYAYKKQLVYIFAEAIIRTRKGNILQMPTELEKKITSNTLYPIFEKQLCISQGVINTKQSEIPFFFLVWLSMSKTIDVFKEPLINALYQQQAQQNTQIFSATDLMVNRFQDEFFPIEEDEFLRFRNYILSGHFFARYFKGFNTDMTGNTYKAIFKERYPRMTEKMRRFIEVLHEESNNPIFLEADFLMIPYLKNALYLDEPCKYEVPITVLVESDMPSLMTKNYIEQLQGHFNYLYNVTFTDVFSTDTKEVDVLLTTGTFKDLKKAYPKARLVVIGRRLGLNDLDRLTQVLKEVSKEKQ
ncbi:helix-turn-helix domain-containing protein [Enterococcus raffinosus]|uniref:helix-turn-helix domain-containing protein n=1 Tax=Enterococcus raffinosus TaxID=71452 RepID=UPI001C1216BC|nr:helix-turn-helix domain-containing protein [Enterococcus raffinosus]MBU5361447.1 helix-turn-helix domain-containing protein [Enterococcus raffinosus]